MLCIINCDRPCNKGHITHLTEIEFLISFESLDIAMSNIASGGFISVSVLKFQHLK